jgi:hypothetical protein
MASNTNFALYWDPAGAPAYPAGYRSGIDEYLENLAHDSGGLQNVDSVATQYGDSAGEFASYNSHFNDLKKEEDVLIDTDPYPPNGCTAAAICFTGAQLEAEIESYVQAHKLPHDLAHEYFLLTPPGVEDCAEATACSAGTVIPFYCAYHGFIPLVGGSIIYANDPYVTGNGGCDTGQHPNNKPSDGALQGGLSHEHNESITDPEVNAWFDVNGEENGDKCRTFVEASEFGTPIGTAPDGSPYNQLINGAQYWYQQEWSNAGPGCEQRLGPPRTLKVSPKRGHAVGGATVTITGSGFSGATAVAFGGLGAEYKLLSPAVIQAVAPPHAKGVVDVIVTTPSGTSAPSRKDHFRYTR